MSPPSWGRKEMKGGILPLTDSGPCLCPSPGARAAALSMSKARAGGGSLGNDLLSCPSPSPTQTPSPMAALGPRKEDGPSQDPAEGATHSTCLAPQHHAWDGCHGRVSTLAPSSPFPWRETLRGTHHHMLEVPGELEEPQPQTEGSYAPFPKRVPSGASRKGRLCQYVPPTT